jgi:hypothetical protein
VQQLPGDKIAGLCGIGRCERGRLDQIPLNRQVDAAGLGLHTAERAGHYPQEKHRQQIKMKEHCCSTAQED